MAYDPERTPRVIAEDGPIIMVPMDHGISIGPVVDPVATLHAVREVANLVTVHKGLLRHVMPFRDHVGVLMHLSASTDRAPDPNDKRTVATVAEAKDLGADGVSYHFNLGSTTEAHQMDAVGAISTDCNRHGMPLLGMVYPRGPGIRDAYDSAFVAHAARLGVELGADIVKVPYTGSAESFEPVVKGALGTPVIVAGGAKARDFDLFLEAMRGARDGGAVGVSIGRNVFESKDPKKALDAIAEVFRP